ncbi:hypothetical protein YUBABA_01020 [Serratia phage vB_SmaM-Yubaba]|nr:hypothetical protein YUBABA_01020 [Serratia phage vB_SmaM-Yubaba]
MFKLKVLSKLSKIIRVMFFIGFTVTAVLLGWNHFQPKETVELLIVNFITITFLLLILDLVVITIVGRLKRNVRWKRLSS